MGTHGYLGNAEWARPTCAVHSDDLARPGYISESASEYLDQPDVLAAKVSLLAELVRRSSNLVAYTGAGLSTSSGIGDYASRAKGTLAVHWDTPSSSKKAAPLSARPPTRAHRVLAALERAGAVQQWVNQNHDGLAQKATFPQSKLIEIHGSWFDPRNPVVKMNGALRSDLYARMRSWARKADVVLALGTSLSGLASDCVAEECAKRAIQGRACAAAGAPPAAGLVIVSLQRTRLDSSAALRIYARLDETLDLLARELEIGDVPTDAEVAAASRDPSKWYTYDPADRTWTRETRQECLERAQPSRAAAARASR